MEEGMKESHPRVLDLQQPRLCKLHRWLQILDTRIGFCRPSLHVIIDYIILLILHTENKSIPSISKIIIGNLV